MNRLKDKTALVTGAGSGIGRAAALLFASEGASVACADLSQGSAEEAASEIERLGGRALALSGDVSVADVAAAMVDGAVDVLGRLEIVVNSAGVTARNALPPGSDPDDVWDRVIEINLKGTYLVSRCAVEYMRSGGGGSIVNLASTMGMVGYPPGLGGALNPYPPSKGGVIQLTRNMAVDLGRDNIRVNCLCPGFVETDLTKSLTDDPATREMLESRHPLGRLGRPGEVAHAALSLASDEASYVTGAALTVDGGYTAV